MKTSLKTAALLLTFYVLTNQVHSNGGPLDDIQVKKNGHHSFKNAESVRLVQESLDITILGEYAEYRVEYELENKGGAVTLEYGFPIDFYSSSYEPKEPKITPEGIKQVLSSFEMKLAGKPIVCQQSNEKTEVSDSNVDEGTLWRVWHRTQLKFEAGAKRRLLITYKAKSSNDDMIFSKSFKPEYTARKLNYSFTGAKYWGDGKAEKVSVSIHAGPLREQGGNITTVEPVGYVKAKDGYSKTYNDVAIGSIPDLWITYDNEKSAFSKYVAGERIPRKAIKSIRASSTLKNGLSGEKQYAVENLLDGLPETAWVEGQRGSGKGVTIEVEISGYILAGIGILNGYLKDGETFTQNGRVTVLKTEVEHYDSDRNNQSVTLALKKYGDFNPKTPWAFVDWVEDLGDGFQDASVIRLVIEEDKAGAKFSDTAISELFLLGYPIR